jgi:hypothetical protein
MQVIAVLSCAPLALELCFPKNPVSLTLTSAALKNEQISLTQYLVRFSPHRLDAYLREQRVEIQWDVRVPILQWLLIGVALVLAWYPNWMLLGLSVLCSLWLWSFEPKQQLKVLEVPASIGRMGFLCVGYPMLMTHSFALGALLGATPLQTLLLTAILVPNYWVLYSLLSRNGMELKIKNELKGLEERINMQFQVHQRSQQYENWAVSQNVQRELAVKKDFV